MRSNFRGYTEGPDISEAQVREIAIRELLIEKVFDCRQDLKQVEDWEQKFLH